MAIEEPEPAGRRVVRVATRRRGVRLAVLSATEALFAEQDLSEAAIREIAQRARLVHHKRGEECFRSTTGHVFLLERGCVREDFPDGTARLWGPGTLIGNWTGARLSARTRATTLTESSAGLVLIAADIAQIGATHGQVVYAVGRMGMHRLHAAETVYGASRLSPLSRVAKLLLFLSHYSGYYDTHRRDGQRVVAIARDGLVEGPTQADIADALGLSRASVEKTIAVLRGRGVLRQPQSGEHRTNRRYVIMDREKLERVVIAP
ncbi:Crp/Fnr family transcriptional regulator [Streptomyces swartbergensis]|uniref:Crp/Fnr family transcriptional regulator n=1 Tax=Streptomyces swartbergensis TaxID=487165 RepID=UPI0038284AC5